MQLQFRTAHIWNSLNLFLLFVTCEYWDKNPTLILQNLHFSKVCKMIKTSVFSNLLSFHIICISRSCSLHPPLGLNIHKPHHEISSWLWEVHETRLNCCITDDFEGGGGGERRTSALSSSRECLLNTYSKICFYGTISRVNRFKLIANGPWKCRFLTACVLLLCNSALWILYCYKPPARMQALTAQWEDWNLLYTLHFTTGPDQVIIT